MASGGSNARSTKLGPTIGLVVAQWSYKWKHTLLIHLSRTQDDQHYCWTYVLLSVFTARRHATAVYTVVVSVCLSVCLSQVRVLLKRLCVGSRKQRHTIARDSTFLIPKTSAKLKRGHSQRRRQMQVGYVRIGDFQQITRYNSKTPTVASVLNLVRSHVYHTERPPLFAARMPWCSASRGFVSDSWYLFYANVAFFQQLIYYSVISCWCVTSCRELTVWNASVEELCKQIKNRHCLILADFFSHTFAIS